MTRPFRKIPPMKFFALPELKDFPQNVFPLPLGLSDGGKWMVADFFKAQHLLIGGGAGKIYSYLNFLIKFFASKYSPEELKLCINAHKKDAFACAQALPHLLGGKINITAPEILAGSQNLYRTYRDRHNLLAKENLDFFGHNKTRPKQKLPLIVSITFDYSRLPARKTNENLACALACKAFYAKNTGVFLIVAASNYAEETISRDVFDAYFPSRMSFCGKIKNPRNSVLIESNADADISESQCVFLHAGKGGRIIQTLQTPNYE